MRSASWFTQLPSRAHRGTLPLALDYQKSTVATDKHYGYFDGTRLKAQTFAVAVKSYPIGTPLEITVRKAIDSRSVQQNRYYWGIVVASIRNALHASGITLDKQQTHDMLKFRFLRHDLPIGHDGEFITTVDSTADMDVEAFMAYTDQCIHFAAEYLNITIPAPGEQAELEMA